MIVAGGGSSPKAAIANLGRQHNDGWETTLGGARAEGAAALHARNLRDPPHATEVSSCAQHGTASVQKLATGGE